MAGARYFGTKEYLDRKWELEKKEAQECKAATKGKTWQEKRRWTEETKERVASDIKAFMDGGGKVEEVPSWDESASKTRYHRRAHPTLGNRIGRA